MELAVYNIKGEETGRKLKLNEQIFSIEPNDHAIYLDVKQYMANLRQGTHSTLEVSTISGSTRKIKRQKGTGGARAGSIKSPLFRGGARTFGPQPRVYNFKLNKKLKKIARLSALSYKMKEGSIKIVEDFTIETPKTKAYLDILKSLQVDNRKSLMVLPHKDENVVLSSRNIQNARVMRASDINTYEILRAKYLVLTESSVKQIEKAYDTNNDQN
ncbi:MAG: 50S ribosomal protein L4 [Bacteroidales bacterium]|jgi:large subunit ribosomal protein L4